jgi:hypothetical protein
MEESDDEPQFKTRPSIPYIFEDVDATRIIPGMVSEEITSPESQVAVAAAVIPADVKAVSEATDASTIENTSSKIADASVVEASEKTSAPEKIEVKVVITSESDNIGAKVVETTASDKVDVKIVVEPTSEKAERDNSKAHVINDDEFTFAVSEVVEADEDVADSPMFDSYESVVAPVYRADYLEEAKKNESLVVGFHKF